MLRYSVLVLFVVTLTGAIVRKTKFRKNTSSTSSNVPLPDDSLTVASPGEVLDSTLLHIHFCGDTLPLNDAAVARRYQRAVNQYDYPEFAHYRKKVSGELKTIGKILKAHKIPSDFRYIPVVESYFLADAVSPKGASGYWQFMPETARALGLRIDEQVDERLDLQKSTHAAAKYLKWLYGQLGDWTLVAAAYNMGPGRLIRHMDVQKKNDFFQLRLNSETSKYIYKLVAVKEWFNRPSRCERWIADGFLVRLAEFNKRNAQYREVMPKGEEALVKALGM